EGSERAFCPRGSRESIGVKLDSVSDRPLLVGTLAVPWSHPCVYRRLLRFRATSPPELRHETLRGGWVLVVARIGSDRVSPRCRRRGRAGGALSAHALSGRARRPGGVARQSRSCPARGFFRAARRAERAWGSRCHVCWRRPGSSWPPRLAGNHGFQSPAPHL